MDTTATGDFNEADQLRKALQQVEIHFSRHTQDFVTIIICDRGICCVSPSLVRVEKRALTLFILL